MSFPLLQPRTLLILLGLLTCSMSAIAQSTTPGNTARRPPVAATDVGTQERLNGNDPAPASQPIITTDSTALQLRAQPAAPAPVLQAPEPAPRAIRRKDQPQPVMP